MRNGESAYDMIYSADRYEFLSVTGVRCDGESGADEPQQRPRRCEGDPRRDPDGGMTQDEMTEWFGGIMSGNLV